MNNQTIVYKVPGKVLISGGYGVLEQNNIGLTLAVDCFFYSTCRSTPSNKLLINVISPQISKNWRYEYQDNNLIEIGNQPNKYVSAAIKTVFEYFKNKEIPKQQFTIYLLFDQGFLSVNQTHNKEQNKDFRQYVDTSKQGLGSSACVVVSIVNILCKIFEQHSKQLIARLSNIANLTAQGKIGSNFDISSAIYGSHLYTNIFPKYALQYIQSKGTSKQLFSINNKIQTLNFSHKYQVLLVDLFQGSDTVKMVSRFLTRLNEQNEQIKKRFFTTSRQITEELFKILEQNEINKFELKALNIRHRKMQQQYGKLTQTEIQPESIKQKLDQLCQNQDVLYVICPGSGGYDSVAVLLQKGKQLDNYKTKLSLNSSGLCQCTLSETQKVFNYINSISK